MADAPELETKINTITDQIKELLKQVYEPETPLNMEKNNRLRGKISRLHEERDRLTKELTGQSPKRRI